MTVGGKIRFFSLRFYIERSFLSSVFTRPYYEWQVWQVLSTFLTSFPLAKRFAPRQKVCVLPPPPWLFEPVKIVHVNTDLHRR